MNSLAHLNGMKPYDKSIKPCESNFVKIMSFGEGYHNYHHVFPFDYSTSEVSWTQDLNVSTLFIDMCAKLGFAKNLKKVDENLIKQRVLRTGDTTLNQVYLENRRDSIKWITIMLLVQTLFLIPTLIYCVRILLFFILSYMPSVYS